MVAQKVKSLLAVRETWVRSLGQEDPLGEEMATLSSEHRSVLIWATGLQNSLQSSGPQPYLFQCGLNLSLGEEEYFPHLLPL